MNIKLKKSSLKGEITIQPSKSYAHRAIICASLADGISKIDNIVMSKDIIATIKAMESLGAIINIKQIKEKRHTLEIIGSHNISIPDTPIDCNESGSTLRFILPIVCLNEKEIVVTGKNKLKTRPIGEFFPIFIKSGVSFEYNGSLPIKLKGKLKSDNYHIKGDVSSQYITGLLFALPLLDGDSKIFMDSELQSKDYVKMTLSILKKFGINITVDSYMNTFHIKGNQKYIPCNYFVEGDYSQGAFFFVGGSIDGDICIKGLSEKSLQGDKEIIDIILSMGGEIIQKDNSYYVHSSTTNNIDIDVSEIPDLVPALAVLMALSKGKSTIYNGQRLRIKESDRIKSVVDNINAIGGKAFETEDGMVIEGVNFFKGGTVDSFNDHRIVMAFSMASLKSKDPIIIKNAKAIEKSYPDFLNDYRLMGGKVNELNL